MAPHQGYPLRLEGRLEGEPSRWLWLVKWLLAIPHYIVLAFLWIAFFVLTVVAFFAILFTTRYPRGIFDFNLGVLRWTWRVAFYSYGALGTDRYPPFSLGEEPDYPATLDVAYPERLSRGLVLVKWWLLAIPHYLVLGLLLGGGSAAGRAGHWHWGWGWGWTFSTGLIGLLVLFAGVALLFTTRYPRGLFDLVLGFDRWVARVAAYAGLMTDAYPPFRLDQGGGHAPVAPPEAPPSPAAAIAEDSPAAPAAPARSGAARVVLLVLGTIAALLALVTLVGGAAMVVIDQTQRDDDGFLMSPTEDFSTSTYAIVSESADVDIEGAERAVQAFLGDVRIRSESERPVFVGIARETDAAPYVDAIERDVVTGIGDEPRYSRETGGQPAGPPEEQAFWVASSSGAGEQTLEWEPEEGSWTVVAMNTDASRGVSTELSIGAELDSVVWIGIGLLVFGGLLAAAAALAITAGARRRA
jgi:uncharacterized protein DUF4389